MNPHQSTAYPLLPNSPLQSFLLPALPSCLDTSPLPTLENRSGPNNLVSRPKHTFSYPGAGGGVSLNLSSLAFMVVGGVDGGEE